MPTKKEVDPAVSKADLAEDICEELDLDYNRLFAELEVDVSTAFLEAVHEEIVQDEEEYDFEKEEKSEGLEPDAWMYDWDKIDDVSPVSPELAENWKEDVDSEKMWPLYSAKSISVLAHRLWTHWSQHIAEEEDISEDRLERWEGLWIPYEDLSEEDKEDDRRLVQRFLSEKPDYSFEIDATGDTQLN